MTEEEKSQGRLLATVSYLTIFGALIAIFLNMENKNRFTSFHSRQGLGLCLSFLAMGYVISQMDNIAVSMGFWLFFGILFLYGIIGAVSGKSYEVPILGGLFQKWFANIGK